MTIQSTRYTAAVTVLALMTAAALGLLADRNVGTAAVLAGVAAVLGVLTVAILLADAVTRPLVELAAAVQTLARDRSAEPDIRYSNVVASHTITAWNPAAERLYQYTAAEAIGRNIEIIIPPDRLEEHRVMVDRALQGEPIEDFETVRLARDGRRIDVSLSLRPFKSGTGEITGLTKFTRDITELRFADEKFRLAVESCPSGMVMIDGAGKIVMVNGEIERLFGYPRVELIGQPIDILVPERLRRGTFGTGAGSRATRKPGWRLDAIFSDSARTAANFWSKSASIQSVPARGCMFSA
jgi:PAS domain S-box-containing protein